MREFRSTEVKRSAPDVQPVIAVIKLPGVQRSCPFYLTKNTLCLLILSVLYPGRHNSVPLILFVLFSSPTPFRIIRVLIREALAECLLCTGHSARCWTGYR